MSWLSALGSLAFMVVIVGITAWAWFGWARPARVIPWIFVAVWLLMAFHAVICVVDLFLGCTGHALYEFGLALVIAALMRWLMWFGRKLARFEAGGAR